MRPFVSQFVLPLVRGGKVHVSRPLGPLTVSAMAETWAAAEGSRQAFAIPESERAAATSLAEARASMARALLIEARPPVLDEPTLRLAAAVHDLLALSHPDLDDDAGTGTQRRIAEAALTLADLGPPRSVQEAVDRHTVLARVPEVVQPERVVNYWLGRRRFVGRTPPARLTALPKLRRVKTEEVRRLWMREVGVIPIARPAWIALHRASPLAEALDPLRLDPPLSWERVLPVLRFPALARLTVGRLLQVGITPGGDAYAAALLRWASLREPALGNGSARPASVAFALRFLAHAVWMDVLYGDGPSIAAGDLAALLVAAREVDRSLCFPPDVRDDAEPARAFSARLDAWRADLRARAPERLRTAERLCRHAASAGRPALPA